jgi:hypothetical protein
MDSSGMRVCFCPPEVQKGSRTSLLPYNQRRSPTSDSYSPESTPSSKRTRRVTTSPISPRRQTLIISMRMAGSSYALARALSYILRRHGRYTAGRRRSRSPHCHGIGQLIDHDCARREATFSRLPSRQVQSTSSLRRARATFLNIEYLHFLREYSLCGR